IVRRICRELGAAPGGRPIRVSVAADLPLVLADESRVGQMLVNLLENALKYAPHGPIAVSAAPGPEEVVVRVVDEGPGIETADREHVFERFYRGRQVRESARPGSGLGLYLCRRLAEAQGGRIWLDSTEQGTSIAFSLPLAGRPVALPG
ncbi:MAG: sensor histidine kinase, partial [Candidatus Limnocylindrales bacterium]